MSGRFKQGLIVYMSNFGLTRTKLSEHVASYRNDPDVLPRKDFRDRIREFHTAHLLDQALDMVDEESDDFWQHTAPLKDLNIFVSGDI